MSEPRASSSLDTQSQHDIRDAYKEIIICYTEHLKDDKQLPSITGIFTHISARKVESVVECLPQLIPAASATAYDVDFHVTEIVFTNETADDATVTVLDRQSTPRALFLNTTIPANSAYGVVFEGRWMPNGFTWVASAANSITATVRGY